MAKKLSTDYINWVLTLNAKQAHEEFHKLEKDNKGLQQQSRDSRKAMVELEKQGKKGSPLNNFIHFYCGIVWPFRKLFVVLRC